MKTLIIDNYDSFTYNLAQYVAELGGNPIVFRNDKITLPGIVRMKPTHIIISPGPGTPAKKKYFGVSGEVIRKLGKRIPLLGVCLGHQGIIHQFGGKIIRAPEIMHGKQSIIELKSIAAKIPGLKFPNLFRGLPKRLTVMRYHSLVGEKSKLPSSLFITGETAGSKLVMAVQHMKFPIYGIQFHPESIGTPQGKDIIKNFLKISC